MTHPISPVDTFTATVTVPDGTDLGSQRSELIEAFVQALTNRTHNLNLHTAKIDQANTFVGLPLTLDGNSSSVPAIQINKSAHDHPGASSNRWKLLAQYILSSGQAVRVYSGEGDFGDGSAYAITTNAVWDPAPGPGGSAQRWFKDSDLKESNIVRLQLGGEMHYYGRQPGGGTWGDQDWDDQGRGVLKVGDTVVSKNLSISETGTFQTVHTTGGATFDTNIVVNGSIDSGTDIFAADDVIAGNEFQYGPPIARNIIIPLASAYGAVFKNFESELVLDGSSVVTVPVRPPHGATLASCDVMYSKAGSSEVKVFSVRRHSMGWGGGGTHPTLQQTGVTSNSSGSGNYVINVTFGNLTVSKDEDYEIVIQDGDNSDRIYAIRMNFTDPGPRNH